MIQHRILPFFMAMLLLLSSCSTINLNTEPASYRYLYTQSYDYVQNTPDYAEAFVQQYIDPIKHLDDYSKAVIIMGLVCRQMEYDYTALNGTRADKIRANNLDNFFLTGSGICWAYSRAYCYLCREAGLRAYEIVGTANGSVHAWCAVWINGIHYYVDCTYYDTGAPFNECFSNHPLSEHRFSYI